MIFFTVIFSKFCKKFRSSHQRCSTKKDVLKNFVIFTGKHLYGWRPTTLLKRDFNTGVEQIQKLCDIFLFYFFLVFYEKVDNPGLLIWKPLKFWGLLDLSISDTASSLRFYTGLPLMAYTGFYSVIETVSQKFQFKWFQQINLQKRCYGS